MSMPTESGRRAVMAMGVGGPYGVGCSVRYDLAFVVALPVFSKAKMFYLILLFVILFQNTSLSKPCGLFGWSIFSPFSLLDDG
jgi:hypothetical protein